MGTVLRMSESAVIALHSVALMARHPERRFSNVEIAEIVKISPNTLSKAMQTLVRCGLVDSRRGLSGGFCFALQPEAVTLRRVYETIDGPIGQPSCPLARPEFAQADECLLSSISRRVHQDFYRAMDETTVAQLAESMKLGDDL